MRRLFGLIAVLFVSLTVAQAQNVIISPQSIIVNPVPSFGVEVFVDKDPSGAGNPAYAIGEGIRIGVRVSEDSYVYLFNVRANGTIVQILPNAFDQDNYIRRGETRMYPPTSGARYSFTVDGPLGQDRVIALASRNPLDMNALTQFSVEGSFRISTQGQDSFAQTLSIIVNPLPQTNWVTDTALFTVVQRPGTPQPQPQPTQGTLDVRSTPAGARVFIDNQFVGQTPITVRATPGSRIVRFELSGYSVFQTTVNVLAGRTLQVNASLVMPQAQPQSQPQPQPQPQPGSVVGALFVQANIAGAQVFVNNQFVGTIPSGSGQLSVNSLPVGQHALRVTAPGFTTVEQIFTVNSGQTTRVDVIQVRQ